eukprot:scaffold17546_cov224-Skeletonema_dohrnii-CCMP3373.AAC.1
MATSTNVDPFVNHVITVVLLNNPKIRDTVLSIGKNKTWRGFIDFLKDHNKVRGLKWKHPDTRNIEDLPKEMKELMMEIPNFINWLQNSHGTIMNCPIDVLVEATRERFVFYLGLSNDARGAEADGTVNYDETKARSSEQFNRIGAYATNTGASVPASSGGVINSGGGNNSGGTFSDAERELAAFDKNPPSDKNVSHLLRNSGWGPYAIELRALFRIKGIEHIFAISYQAPSLAHGDEQAAVTLHEKRNTAVFIILFRTIKSSDGSTIVKKYQVSMDGISAWNELVDFHTKDMSAKNRANHLMRLISQTRVRQDNKGLAAAMDEWKNWVRDYNQICDPAAEINVYMQLSFFECYIGNVISLKDCQSRILENEAQFQRVMSPTEKMALYYRNAQSIDENRKVSAIQSRRGLTNVSEMEMYD